MYNMYPIEIRFILTALQAEIHYEDKIWMKEVIESGELDWKEILGQVYTHRVSGLFYVNMIRNGFERNFYKEAKQSLRNTSISNGETNKELQEIMYRVSEMLNENDIPHVFLKGLVVSNHIYKNLNIRTSNDIDVLIPLDRTNTVTELLTKNQFIQGNHLAYEKRIEPISRGQALLWRTQSHQLFPFNKLVNKTYIEKVKIDINYSLNIGRNSNDSFLVNKLLGSRQKVLVGGREIWTLSWEGFLIHLCIHASKEARAIWAVLDRTDLTLYKFCDIHYGIRELPIDWTHFTQLVEDASLQEDVFLALMFTEQIFPGTVSTDVLSAITPLNTDYLHIVTDGTNKLFEWENDIIHRVFSFTRASQINNDSGNFSKFENAVKKFQ